MVDYPERSSLWGLGATAAAGSGIGLSIYHSRNELLSALRVANKDVAGETANIITQLSKFGRQPNASIDILNQHQAGLLNLKGNQRLIQQDIATAAYESILSGRQTTHSHAYNAFKSIKSQPDVLAAYREAGSMIQQMAGNPEILSNKMNSIIAQDMPQSQVGISGGGYFGTRVGLMKKDLSPEAVATMESIQERFSKAAGDNKMIKWTGIYNIKDQFQGQEINTPMLTGKIAGTKVKIPLADTGLVYGGDNLTSRYIARGAYNNTGNSFNYIERYTGLIEEVLADRKSQSETNRSIHLINNDIIGFMNDRDSSARSQVVWGLPEQVMPAGARAKARMISNQAVSLTGEGFIDDIGNTKMLMQRGLYPVGSADAVAKGTLFKDDIAEGLYGPMGKLFPTERVPLQFVRGEWGVTAKSKQLAANRGFSNQFGKYFNRLDRKIKGPDWDRYIYGGADVLSPEAYSSPQLTTLYAIPDEKGFGFKNKNLLSIMSEEEVVLNKTVADIMEHETVTQKKISLKEGFKVNEDIAQKLKGASVGDVVKLDSPVGGGKFLGIDQLTGKELWSEVDEATKRTQVIAAEITGNNMATLYTREQYRLNENEPWKFFSEESKFMGSLADDKKWKEVRAATSLGENVKIAGQEIEAIQSGKLLQKNILARYNQQVEAMSIFAADKLSNVSEDIRNEGVEFLTNPEQYLRTKELLQANQATAEFEINKRMVSLGNKFGFSKEEMGLTFGLMDSASAEALGIKSAVEEATDVIGLSKMRLGSPASLGVGGLGSIEQSGLRLMAMKGEEGQRMAAELVTRFQGKDEFGAAEKMLTSAINETSKLDELKGIFGKGGISTDSRLFTKLAKEDLITEEGRFVDLGRKVKEFGGASKLYIPGFNEAPDLMTGTISNSGEKIQSETARELRNLQMALKSEDDDAINIAAKNFRNLAQREYERQGSAYKAKVLGSRFLTGFRLSEAASKDQTYRISKEAGAGMFNELIEQTSDSAQKEFLEAEKSRLLAGETLTGGAWRHPTTGPESFQFMKYKVDPNIKGNLVHVPAKFGNLEINGETRKVDISQMVGMKGDFDKDMYAISAIADRDTSARVAKKIGSQTEAEYTKYLFNHYAMKDVIDNAKDTSTKTIANMTREEALTVGARNLTEAKIATPKVNLALQKLKLGVQYSAPEEYRPLGELFYHLEEAAIGGKHGTVGKIAGTSLYQNIASAVESKDVGKMENVLTGLFGNQRTVKGSINGAEQMLDINPARWAKVAIESAANISDEVDAAYKSTRIAKGTLHSDNIAEIIELMNRRKSGSVDVAQSLMYSNFAGKKTINETVNRGLQQGSAKFSAVKRALSKNKKFALAGVAIAAGIGFMSPSISGSIPANPMGPNGGRNLNIDSMGPPGGLEMNPPQARIQRSPEVHSISPSSRANIRMSLNDSDESSDMIMRNARKLAEGGKVNIRTIDDRSALDSHRLASKIHERL